MPAGEYKLELTATRYEAHHTEPLPSVPYKIFVLKKSGVPLLWLSVRVPMSVDLPNMYAMERVSSLQSGAIAHFPRMIELVLGTLLAENKEAEVVGGQLDDKMKRYFERRLKAKFNPSTGYWHLPEKLSK